MSETEKSRKQPGQRDVTIAKLKERAAEIRRSARTKKGGGGRGGAGSGRGGAGSGGSKPSRGFFRWLPWEKLTIWALFLFLVYTLRHFFSVIFLTFIFSYIMTTIVRSTLRIISPSRERQSLHRVLIVIVFGLLLSSLYGLVVFLKEPLKQQIVRMQIRINALEVQPQTLFEDLARETIGKWRYNEIYDSPEGREREAEQIAKFQKEEFRATALKGFRKAKQDVEGQFQTLIIDEHGQTAYAELESAGTEEKEFGEWLRQSKAGDVYLAELDKRNSAFDNWYTGRYGQKTSRREKDSLEDLKRDPEQYGKERREWVIEQITTEFLNTPDDEEYDKLIDEFQKHLGAESYYDLVNSDRYQEELHAFYDNLTERETLGYSFEKYFALDTALKQHESQFYRILLEDIDPERRDDVIKRSFRRERQGKLAKEALRDWEFLQIKKQLTTKIQELVPQLVGKGYEFARDLFQFVAYFALSLMLSFFITFDLPRIRKGIQRLEKSQIKNFYLEIAPGLAAFGTLIGRAFQAQGIIAICNTLLTLGLIKALDIPFEIFLCTIVFFCSFIPVLGVVLSTVPIALVALIDRGLFVALFSVGGVLIIHFIETSILNPKILGEMLHLHPVLVLGILVIGEHFFHVWGLLLGVPIMVYIIRYVILHPEQALAVTKGAAALPARGGIDDSAGVGRSPGSAASAKPKTIAESAKSRAPAKSAEPAESSNEPERDEKPRRRRRRRGRKPSQEKPSQEERPQQEKPQRALSSQDRGSQDRTQPGSPSQAGGPAQSESSSQRSLSQRSLPQTGSPEKSADAPPHEREVTEK